MEATHVHDIHTASSLCGPGGKDTTAAMGEIEAVKLFDKLRHGGGWY